MHDMTRKALFYGDCYDVLQKHLDGEAFAFPWNSSIHGIPKAGEGQGGLDFG
jgi:hypothetical protein